VIIGTLNVIRASRTN